MIHFIFGIRKDISDLCDIKVLERYIEVLERYIEVLGRYIEVLERYIEVLERYIEVLERYIVVLERYSRVLERYIRVLERYIRVLERYIVVLERYIEVLERYIEVMERYIEVLERYIGVLERYIEKWFVQCIKTTQQEEERPSYILTIDKEKEKARKFYDLRAFTVFYFGGERGIRTPGTSQFIGFQDRRDRPLCHLSNDFSIALLFKSSAKVGLFLNLQTDWDNNF